MRRGNRRGGYIGQIVFLIVLVGLGVLVWYSFKSWLTNSEVREAAETAEQFYKYEQTGDFGSSWDLFSAAMKERFDKQNYIQSRAHVFMQHFNVKSFKFSLTEPKLEYDVKLVDNGPVLEKAYKMVVTQVYETQFGNFSIVQPCYVSLELGQWKLSWIFTKDGEEQTEGE
ncbi:hypothetical protein Q5741_12300 [Paenibacillus sp. JX-17]|uniref:Uncharacterized protein n=1 Tax=Paenibacillus lacisoli TaxID=3064525 RepID=A0ABT9CD59_9BACL|nr:hypothetical protein [Paenibacillus sp. JX-17]MDO7907191.1 hypothetical protein [Paenibacillus sp. JX-17]